MTFRGAILALGGIVVLVCAVLLQRCGARTAGDSLSRSNFRFLLPGHLVGAAVYDESIAATPEMQRAVDELLNFNEGLYRTYQFPRMRISIYVAWWEAGRMSSRLVAGHTPDVCWPGNGWVRDLDSEKANAMARECISQSGFYDAELRVFVAKAKPEYVAYWHKVGDRVLSYNKNGAPQWWAWVDELLRDGIELRKEQLFVRISSDVPLQSYWNDSEFSPLREALLNLGLRRVELSRH